MGDDKGHVCAERVTDAELQEVVRLAKACAEEAGSSVGLFASAVWSVAPRMAAELLDAREREARLLAPDIATIKTRHEALDAGIKGTANHGEGWQHIPIEQWGKHPLREYLLEAHADREVLLARLAAAEERAVKLDAVKVGEVEAVLDKHRAAFGVAPPQAPGGRPRSRPYIAEDRQKARSPVYGEFEAMGQLESDVIEWLSENYDALRRRAAERRVAAQLAPEAPTELAIDPAEWLAADNAIGVDKLMAAEKKNATFVTLAQALFAAQRGDRATAAYEASEKLRAYVESIGQDGQPLTREQAEVWAEQIADRMYDALSGDDRADGIFVSAPFVRDALMAAARGETEPR